MKLSCTLLALPVLGLAACQSAPAGETSAPPPVEARATCPDIVPGSGDYSPPFPTGCEAVQASEDGLQWLEITQGPDGKSSPEAGATVIVEYEGYLAADGSRIDSSYARGEPAVFNVDQVIEGWTRTLKRMTPGDEWLVYIPSELAYGASPPGKGIPANADLVFKVRLEGFMSREEAEALEQEAAVEAGLGPAPELWNEFLPWDPAREGVTTVESGLSYYVLDSGAQSGRPVTADDMVAIDYEARLADSQRIVGTTWNQEAPLVVKAGDLIPGFAQLLTLMKPGDLWIAHLPASIAYGDEGLGEAIPPGSDLVYLVNLITTNPRAPATPG